MSTSGTSSANAAKEPAPAAPDDSALLDEEAVFSLSVKAVAALSGDELVAERHFTALTASCVGPAGLAYLAWSRGDDRAALAHLARARATQGTDGCDAGESSDPGTMALSALRTGLDKIGHDHDWQALLLPCDVFEKHPVQAFQAYATTWGSTLDLPAFQAKFECAKGMIRRGVTDTHLPAVETALQQAMQAPFDVVPIPQGTMWASNAYGAQSTIVKAVIAPELIQIDAGLDQRLKHASEQIRGHVPGFDVRLSRFSSTRTKLSGPLGEVLCATAARHSHPLDAAKCTRMASEIVTQSLAQWLEIKPWESPREEGGP